MSYAQMALDGQSAVAPVSNKRIASLETKRVIFFAGDAVPPHEKYEMPEVKGFGGMYLPHLRTMPQGANQASRGMLYRCKLTPLTTKMKPEWKSMLSPDARETWDSEFVQTGTVAGESVERTVKGFMGSDANAIKETGEFKSKRSDHLVYKKRYAGHDVRMATRRSLPNGVGGVVEIEALQGASDADIREAQLFFFPEWNQIVQGLEDLPELTVDLERHIRERTAQINNQGWDSEKRMQYMTISRDMLRSCTEFRRTGAQIVQTDEKAFKAAAKDDSQGFSPISTHLLAQLNITRKEDVVTGGNDAVNRLANALEKQQPAASNPMGMTDEEMLEYLTWKLQRKVAGTPVSIPAEKEDVSPVSEIQMADTDGDGSPDFGDVEDKMLEAREAESRQCGRPKANGEPCERALKGDEISCFQHPIE